MYIFLYLCCDPKKLPNGFCDQIIFIPKACKFCSVLVCAHMGIYVHVFPYLDTDNISQREKQTAQ